ncbi:MAG: hypothetical protein O6766_06525 [Gammaproteobacteria bacterium]|nr:hypothetical protein [Gammaproteobacteria bacterium]
MKTVLNLFWQLCLLRQSPEYVPTQSWFIAAIVVGNLITSALLAIAGSVEQPVLSVVTSVVVGQATTAGLVGLALFLREHPERLLATITAIFGCDLIITACFGVLMPLTSSLADTALSITYLAFLVWSITVTGFILHRALSTNLPIGITVAMGILVLSVSTSQVAIGSV